MSIRNVKTYRTPEQIVAALERRGYEATVMSSMDVHIITAMKNTKYCHTIYLRGGQIVLSTEGGKDVSHND